MRLWPLSRLGRPKQMIALAGERTLLQQTALRVGGEAMFAAPVVVAAAAQADAIEEQLAEAGVEPALLILEPGARNTAPAIALAALASAPGDLLLVLPSDHLVKDEAAFRAAVSEALPAAEAGWLVTFGLTPERPETGYGYIRRGDAIGASAAAYRVDSFVEKPDRATAEAYLADGGYLWNSGMFLFRSDAYLAALKEHAPYLLPAVEAAMAGAERDGARLTPNAASFARAPAQSIDHAVMERHGRAAVVPAAMGWSDIGSWEALHLVLDKDDADNVLAGDVIAIDCEGSLIRSDGPVVAAIGARDLIVVATERSVLIVPRGQSQRVQEAVEALIRRGAKPPEDLPGG